MKEVWVRPSSIQPITLAKDGVVTDKGVEAIINGPSKVVWNPKAEHPKVWIEIEDSVEVIIVKET